MCRLLHGQQPKKPSSLTDSLLVEQCKKNSSSAQLELYKRYCDGMFIVANRYVKDTAAAEDAMQEAFIKAFQKLHQYQGEVTFGAWLKRIVINTCLDVIKARKVSFSELNEETLHIADEPSEAWNVSDETTLEEVKNAIEQLAYNYKAVVQLYLVEGYDHQEISEILNISESASRTNLHRGKLQLQKTLKHLKYGTGY